MIFTNKLLIIVLSVIYLPQSLCTRHDWESQQFHQFLSHGFTQRYFSSDTIETIDDVIKDARKQMKAFMKRESVPGAVMAFSIKGKTVWTEGFGYSDTENNVSTHKDSVWRMASVSKPLTSALIGRLMEKNMIDLDQSIHKYLPKSLYPHKKYNGTAVKITVRQVLSHMACLHYTEIPDDFAEHPLFRAENVSQTILRFSDEKLRCKPGTEYSYSNYGFQVVGAIIEAILHNTYESEMKDMFVMLAMNSTFAERIEDMYKHRPQYYQIDTQHLVDPDIPINLRKTDVVDSLFGYEGWWPSAGIVSTAQDLLKFGNAMLYSYNGHQNDFLKKRTVKELWAPETVKVIRPQYLAATQEYGKGWFITRTPANVSYPYKTFIWHSGGLIGTSNIFMIFPKENMVGVALTNRGFVMSLDQMVLYVAKNLKKFL